jgi:lambda family phage portal protein
MMAAHDLVAPADPRAAIFATPLDVEPPLVLRLRVLELLKQFLPARAPAPPVRAQRRYEGAAGGRRLANAGAMPFPAASALASRGRLASRVRYLVANNPLAASAAEGWTTGLVGTGIVAQSAHPSAYVRTLINRRATSWVDRADFEGLSDFYGLQRTMARALAVDGEALALLLVDPATNELRVRLLPPECLDASYDTGLTGGARIVGGIELDSAGRRVAYHLTIDPDGAGFRQQRVRVDVSDVLHVFRRDVPGQQRGASWFAPVVLRLHDYDASTDAQLVRQKVAALLCGFVTNLNGEATPPAFADGSPDGLGGLTGGLEPGVMKVLGPGEDVKFSAPADLGQEAVEFLKLTAREIAVGCGLPYEIVSGDLSNVNFSSIRAGLVEWRQRCEALQYSVLAFQALRPIWRRWLTLEVMSGRVYAPGFFNDPESWLSVQHMPPKTPWVDPKADAEAEVTAINAGLLSRRQALAARGYNVEDVDAEIAADNERAARLGLNFGPQPQQTPQIEQGQTP